jgi:hypothetical protein
MRDVYGKYKGTPVYKVSAIDFVKDRCYEDDKNIYLIDRELIRNNEVFASWNGVEVNEYYGGDRYVFYRQNDGGIKHTAPIGTENGGSNSNSEVKTTEAEVVSNFEFKTVDEILAGSFGIDIDAFLNS